MATSKNRRDQALKEWEKYVHRWYPKLQQRAYFVPPVYMKRINYEKKTVHADTVAVATPPVKETAKGTGQINESDVLEDQAQQHILYCLHKFFHETNQVVFVLSQLNFTGYLGEVCYAAAAREFPRTVDLRPKNQDRGDFDFLFIHLQYGLVAFEVKSIGTMFSGEVADQPGEDKTLAKRLQQVVRQMNKSRDVLQYLTGDLPHKPRVTTSLMLPNITTEQLTRVLSDNPRERQALCDCLGIPCHENPADLCLTSDRLSDKTRFWQVTDNVMQALTKWWQSLMGEREDASMTEQLYEDLVARFAGPATTVEVFCPSALPKAAKVVRTEGHAVSETAERYMNLVLSPRQIEILNSTESLVYVTGPPGTGKTVVLMLKAGQWLTEGHDVYVVSTFSESKAASYYLYETLSQKYSSSQGGKVHFVESFDSRLPDACVLNSPTYVIADEVEGTEFAEMIKPWRSDVKDLHLWAARVLNNFIPPDFTVHILTTSLRSPACVTREVQAFITNRITGQVHPYEENPYPHTDGPSPRELRHQGPGHDNDAKPDDCETCGLELAEVLKELHVGESNAETALRDCPRPLKYGDVFVLSLTHYRGSSTDKTGKKVLASGLVTGLRRAGVPVRVFTFDDIRDNEAVKKLTTMTGPDEVVASDMRFVAGLERKVVVWVQRETDDSLMEEAGKLFGYTRSSAQLIIVSRPSDISETPTKDSQLPICQGVEGAVAAAVSDDEEAIEEMLQTFEDVLTEQDVLDIDGVFKLQITFRNEPHVRTFYINIKYDGDRIIRGEWPGPEPFLTCSITIPAESALRVLTGGEKVAMDMLANRHISLMILDSLKALQLVALIQEPRFKAAFLRLKGDMEQVEK